MPRLSMTSDPPKRGRLRVLLICLILLALAGLFAWRVKPGPVYWVDLYWTVLLDNDRSEEHTSELRHLGISYAVFWLKKIFF